MNSDMYNKAKEAIIEKWVTICKTSFLDEVMKWRIKYLEHRFSEPDQFFVKKKLIIAKHMKSKDNIYFDWKG